MPDADEYWIYEDMITRKAKVHRGNCPHCNHGTGRGHGRDERVNRWLGRYGSEDEARSARIRVPVLENCRVCMC